MLPRSLRLIIPCVLILACCAVPLAPRKVSVKERIEFDRAIGSELALQMDPQLSFKYSAPVQQYLDHLGQALADKTPDLHLPEVEILLIQDLRKPWSSYALPGGRVYLSVGLLKKLRFENEVAAMMALELGHLLREQVLAYLREIPSGAPEGKGPPPKTLQAPDDIDFFGGESRARAQSQAHGRAVFAFSEQELLDAVDSGVDIMYAAGYDPRGMTAFFQRFKDNTAHSPWEPEELERLQSRSRERTAFLSPLRNPVVRSDEFVATLEKIRKL